MLGPLASQTAGADAPPTDNLGIGQRSTNWSNSELLAISEEIQAVLDRLDILSPSTFNIAELEFITTNLAPSQNPPDLLDTETLLNHLAPGSSSRQFISTIQSLQSFVHDLDDLLAETHKLDHTGLAQECEQATSNVKAEITRLLEAARGIHSAEAIRKGAQVALGVRRIDFSAPHYPSYQLTPIVTSAIVIIAIIHCFMNVSRDNCNAILRLIRGLLRLVVRAQGSQQHSLLMNSIDKIPITLDTAMCHLGIQANLVFYVVCPRCSTLYPESETIPERCSAVDINNRFCNNRLLRNRHRGSTSWRKPRRRYSHQPLEVWLAHFLNRPGIEDLIENVRPNLQADCTDFWGASYLNTFPGPGERGFFETSVEDLRLAFMIYHDFFNPFTNKMAGKQKSIGVVMMVCLNLPYQIRYNRENVYTVAVIPGPSEPSREEINHYMRPITQNLKEHYSPGVWIARTHKYPSGRHVRSAGMVESMDLLASRAWGGLGPPTHTILCSFCGVHQDEIDLFDKVHPLRNMFDHIQHVQLWMNASDSTEREKIWKAHAARYSEMLCFPWWTPFSAPIAPMHWIKNVLEKQLRENMNWSWLLSTGIPSGPKVVKAITHPELDWGKAAMAYCTSKGFKSTMLTEPILRHLCIERGIFNAGLPSRRMVKELDNWRQQHGIIDTAGELVQKFPDGWAESQVSLPKAEYYLTKSKKASYLVQKSHVNDLKQLCAKYQLSTGGNHHDIASRLIEYYSQAPRPPEPTEADEQKSENHVAVLGRETMAEIQKDMEHTIIPSWLKAPPKAFGTISHGKIGAEEYKSLTLVSMTFSLVRLWYNNKDFVDRLDHFLHLAQAIRILSYQSISKQDIEDFSYHYSAYLSQVKNLYPHCSITPTQHLGLHIPHFLRILGPGPRFNENPSKMFVGMLQDIPINWRFGELEYTLHKEFIAASNLQALLEQPAMARALDEVGEVVQGFLEARHPSHTGVYAKGWNITHPSTPSMLSDEVYNPLVRHCSDRQIHPPTRRQFMCTRAQNGHVVYQPSSASIGNSQILFEVPGTQGWAAGRIESIILQSQLTGSPHPPQLGFFVRRFKRLSDDDCARDPYLSHPIARTVAMMYYEELESELPTMVQAKDIVGHIATCQYSDTRQEFSAPCVVVLSLYLKHHRPS